MVIAWYREQGSLYEDAESDYDTAMMKLYKFLLSGRYVKNKGNIKYLVFAISKQVYYDRYRLKKKHPFKVEMCNSIFLSMAASEKAFDDYLFVEQNLSVEYIFDIDKLLVDSIDSIKEVKPSKINRKVVSKLRIVGYDFEDIAFMLKEKRPSVNVSYNRIKGRIANTFLKNPDKYYLLNY